MVPHASKGSPQYRRSPSPAKKFSQEWRGASPNSAGAADVLAKFDDMGRVSVVVCLCWLRRFIDARAARIKTVTRSISVSVAVCHQKRQRRCYQRADRYQLRSHLQCRFRERQFRHPDCQWYVRLNVRRLDRWLHRNRFLRSRDECSTNRIRDFHGTSEYGGPHRDQHRNR